MTTPGPEAGIRSARAPTAPTTIANPAPRPPATVGTVDPPTVPALTGPPLLPARIGLSEPRLTTSLWDSGRSPPVHILLLGLDGGELRADAIMLLRVEPATGRAALLSVPRDTLATIAEPGSEYPTWDKVGHASAYRDTVLPGFERARRTVTGLLGVRVHRFIAVHLQAFVTIVDAIGGVVFNVPTAMKYSDPYQDLEIDLQPGEQRLGGAQAMGLVRWRQDNTGQGYGDLGRIQTQQAFLRALFEQTTKPTALTRLIPQLPRLLPLVRTDLTLGELTALATLGRRLTGGIEFHRLPGYGGDPGTAEYGYFIMDSAQMPATVARWSREGL